MKNLIYFLNNSQAPLNEDLLDKLNIPIIIIDKNYNVLYSNKLFNKIFSDKGKKCYQRIGKDGPCQYCIGSMSFHNKNTNQKEETIDNNFYNVTSKLLYNKKNELIGIVESYLDISDNRILEKTLIEKNKSFQNDLAIAKQLQKSILPEDLETCDISIYFSYNPCDDLGGDFYNYQKIGKNLYSVFMADVSGHGVSAAMLTMFIKASMKNNEVSPSIVLSDLYNKFNNYSFNVSKYITMFYMVINTKTRTIKYCNAGHNCPPIVYDSFSGKTKLLEMSGIPISSWMDAPDYSDKEFYLPNNNKILLYTDGVIEGESLKGEVFSIKKLIDALLDGNPSPRASLNRIINYLELFSDKEISNVNDDISMAIIDLK